MKLGFFQDLRQTKACPNYRNFLTSIALVYRRSIIHFWKNYRTEISQNRNIVKKCWHQQNFEKFIFEKMHIPIDQLCAKFQYLELGELSQSWDIQKINFANVIIFKFFLNILISVIKTIFKHHFQNSMFYNASKNVWLCRIKLFQCCFLYLVQIYWKLVLGKKIFKNVKNS